MTDMKKIGQAVRELRKQAKLSLESLANEVNYDQGNLSKFERGLQTTDDEMISRIAKVLGTTLPDLLRRAAEIEEQEGKPEVTNVVTLAYPPQPSEHFSEVKKVPVYEGAHLRALADGTAALEKIAIKETIPGAPDAKPRDFAMLVTDDTMTASPGSPQSYPMGHYVYFDPCLEHRSGDAVLIMIGESNITFTTIQNINGAWMMMPLNNRYTSREMPVNAKIMAVAYGTYAVTRRRG